jgi:predicted lipoprotein with Yx(FWY)xxD motif
VILEPAPPVPDWVTVVGSDGGALYADAAGMTLYRLLEDGNATELAYRGGNHCDAACLVRYWDPVLASEELAPLGYWSVIPRGDDTYQWAYKGMPVFTSRLETRPGQLYYTTYRQFQWMKPIMYALLALQGVF